MRAQGIPNSVWGSSTVKPSTCTVIPKLMITIIRSIIVFKKSNHRYKTSQQLIRFVRGQGILHLASVLNLRLSLGQNTEPKVVQGLALRLRAQGLGQGLFPITITKSYLYVLHPYHESLALEGWLKKLRLWMGLGPVQGLQCSGRLLEVQHFFNQKIMSVGL